MVGHVARSDVVTGMGPVFLFDDLRVMWTRMVLGGGVSLQWWKTNAEIYS